MSAIPRRAAFSEEQPWFQTTWDSSSLSTYLRCPRRYLYQVVCGYRGFGESADLVFGLLLHKGLEVWSRERQSRGQEAGQMMGLEAILSASWDADKGKHWQSEDKNKNLWNCLRTYTWYTEGHAFEVDFRTVSLAEGMLDGIELPFQFSLGLNVNGEGLSYCGTIDRLVDTASGRWVVDYKSTKKSLSSDFFDSYQLATQLPGYAVAAKVVFHEPVQGVIVEGLQVGVDFSRSARGHILLPSEKADEWLANATSWILSAVTSAGLSVSLDQEEDASLFAERNARHWRMNTESCFLCHLREVCKASPSVRKHILREMKQEFWDPLRARSQQ